MIEIQTQLLTNCPLCGQNFGLFYLPHGDESIEESKKYKLNQILKNKISGIAKPRSIEQLNTYWACCKLVAELVSDHNNIFSKNDIDFEVKTKVSKNHPSMIKRFKMISGIMYIEPISIAFKNMKHLTACNFFDKAFPVMGDMVQMSPEELIEKAQEKMKARRFA